jgi:hypothetical protein
MNLTVLNEENGENEIINSEISARKTIYRRGNYINNKSKMITFVSRIMSRIVVTTKTIKAKSRSVWYCRHAMV